MLPPARCHRQVLEQYGPLQHPVPQRVALERLDRLYVRRLGDADLPMIHLQTELRQEGALDVAYQLLRLEPRLRQDVDLAHLAQRRGHHPRRKDPLQAGQQVLGTADAPRVRRGVRRPGIPA